MEIVIVVYDNDGKYLTETRVNSIQEGQDFLSSLVVEKDSEFKNKSDT